MEQETREQETKKRRLHLGVNGTAMKIYACAAMLLYTISVSVIQNGLIGVNSYTSEALSQALAENGSLMALSGLASVLQLIGGLAVPVFAFLLVEGFLHTSSFRRYLLTILAFAVISEVPYDLAISGVFWTMDEQNALFTLVVCLIMLYGLRMLQGKKGLICRLCQGCIVLAAILWCSLLHTGFGLCTVLLTAVYYLLYEHNGVRILLGCAISIMYVTGPISGYLLWNYNGDRGWNRNKYVFYAFYPLHLLILGLIAWGLAG